MNEIIDYCIVARKSYSEFTSRINYLISQGWQPHGHCIIKTLPTGQYSLFHSMVRYGCIHIFKPTISIPICTKCGFKSSIPVDNIRNPK